MTRDCLIAFGSVLMKGHAAHDIDLVLPEFNDDDHISEEAVSLDRYEALAHATGKPIDLFFTAEPSRFNVAGYYDPADRNLIRGSSRITASQRP
jgi:hypothetical protein